jgi:hypothetical protein
MAIESWNARAVQMTSCVHRYLGRSASECSSPWRETFPNGVMPNAAEDARAPAGPRTSNGAGVSAALGTAPHVAAASRWGG